MINPEPTRTSGVSAPQGEATQRTLVKAEQKIRHLQDRVTNQKRQIRDLQGQIRHDEALAAEREDLKAEIADLKSEIRELTRANREHVERLQALRAETIKLKTGAKARNPNGARAAAAPLGRLDPALP